MSQQREFLFPLTGAVQSRKFAVIDIESKDGETQNRGFTRPFLACWYNPETGYYFTKGRDCIESMLLYCLTERFDGWNFYAHNGGSFDWLHFLPFIHRMGFWFEIVAVGSSIQMLRVKRSRDDHSKGWTFLDSVKLVPMKLEKAAKSFGVTLKIQHDLDMHEDDPSWRDYVRHDCLALYEVLVRYNELITIRLNGEVGITAASTAMRTFRRGFQKQAIFRHVEHHELFRECYYGGRVERFASKLDGVRVYDINSSYPYSMTKAQPVGPLEQWEGVPTPHQSTHKIGFVRAKVTVPDSTHIPVLPYRHGQKLLFPVGTFRGAWCYQELAKAEELGATVQFEDSVWIDKGTPFNVMVEQLYAYRDKARPDYDEGLATVAKILLNSLYGKFGMKNERERIVLIDIENEIPPEGARPADPKDEECAIWYVPQEAQADYICPQIAAHITTESRLLLHHYFMLASDRGILAYGDTDSIHTTADLSEFVGSKLGMLKDEGNGVVFSGEYLQPKLYRLIGSDGSEKLTMKGFRPPKDKGQRSEYYERVRRGEVVTFKTLEKIGSMARKGFLSPPQMMSVARSIKSEDGKRVPLSATHSRPVRVNEL